MNTNLEEIRAAILGNWAAIEESGKKSTYAFTAKHADPKSAVLLRVRVAGEYNQDTGCIRHKHLACVYSTVVGPEVGPTAICGGEIPDPVMKLLRRSMTLSDFDSLEFYREELAGKVVERTRTFRIEIEAELMATRCVNIRALSEDKALEMLPEETSLSSLWGWSIKGVKSTKVTRIE